MPWSRKLTKAKSSEERDTIWTQIFTNAPLKDISPEHRWDFVGVTEMCLQLCVMRRVLTRKPPKIVLAGQSQTGKSTVFKYLTGKNLKEPFNSSNFNTRMSRQCPAFIELDDVSNQESTLNSSALPVDIIDNPGHDDATNQADVLLDMSLPDANLVILVSSLRDINQIHTETLLEKILNDTRVKILVLINQVDLKLKEEWEKDKGGNSKHYYGSEEEVDSEDDHPDEKFSFCTTLDKLITRPVKELDESLMVDPSVVKSRFTSQPVILQGFNEFYEPFNEPEFYQKVHKSNIKRWIKLNLINNQLLKHE